MYLFLIQPMRATCFNDLIFLDFIIPKIFGKDYRPLYFIISFILPSLQLSEVRIVTVAYCLPTNTLSIFHYN
jgi:hypothetical protein